MISQLIAEKLGLNEVFILRIARSASRRYREYTIPKRSGGERTIHQPSKRLKLIQHALLKFLLCKLPIHKAVFSYKEGVNIYDLAKCHVNNRFLMRIDFKDFFPSLKENDIHFMLKKHFKELSKEDIEFISNIVCKSKALTIGAPSSPFLSNALLYELDSYWHKCSSKKEIVYTRYADDIYFSTNIPNLLDKHYEDFCTYIKAMKSPQLAINTSKTIYTSKKRKRMVTGLILTSENKISIGRERKRTIKALVHQFLKGSLNDTNEIRSLSGYLNFAQMVEPDFILSLKTKYGDTVIFDIINAQSMTHKIQQAGGKTKGPPG